MTDQLSLKRQESMAALLASPTISAAARPEGDADAEQNRLVTHPCRRHRARYARDADILPFPDIVTQRGNNRRRVSLTDEDRRSYLDTLRRKCRDHGLRLLGYCLMSNHVHPAATPEGETRARRPT